MTTKAKGKVIPEIYKISNQIFRYGVIWCVVLVLAISAAQSASAATFTVTTTADNGNNAAPTTGSLREAINLANTTAGADTINFGVTGTITPPVSLPTITEQVTIDASLAAGAVSNTGATGSGFNGTLVVELNGAMAGDGGIGLRISAGNSVVRGLVINRFREAGIRIDTGTGTGIFGNFIGTATNGTAASGNFNRGILIVGSTGNQIGSTAPADSNVISGNSGTGISITAGGSATISRNFIGTDRNGTADIGNTQEGIRIVDSSGSTIGGANSDARNIISGNDGSGISIIQSGNRDAGGNLIPASNNVISANFIGVDVTGNAIQIIGTGSTFQTSPVSNSGSGVLINAAGNTVGGGRTTSTTLSTCENACNVISGNRANGISISSNFSTGNTVTGNNIGVGANGTTAIGNRDNGIQISNLAASSTIGGTSAANGICNNGCNVIANNGDPVNATSGRAGVYIDPTARASNTIRGNSIFTNTGLGIDLGAVGTTANDTLDPDTGANNLQNFPILNAADTNGTITGTLNSIPSNTFAIDFYRNETADTSSASEARTYIGSVLAQTDASGNAPINFGTRATLSSGQFVTATATNVTMPSQFTGDTSEISPTTTVAPAMATAPAGIESDVAPRPNGDTFVDSPDVVQTRIFQLNPASANFTGNEFQRADSAPANTRGDGFIDSTDVVQARIYQLRQDSRQRAGGPASPQPTGQPNPSILTANSSTAKLAGRFEKNAPTVAPEVRVVSRNANAGQMFTLSINVDALGTESVYGFSLNYNSDGSNRLQSPVVTIGTAGGNVRTDMSVPGVIGFSIDFGGNPSFTIGAGDNQQLVTIRFTVPNTATPGTIPLIFQDNPTRRSVSDANANAVPTTFRDGAVTINAPTAAGVTVTGRVLAGRRIIANARVSLTNGAGITRVATTDRNGYYRFDDVAAGETYVFAVRSARRYEFATQVVNITENTDNLNFNAEQ